MPEHLSPDIREVGQRDTIPAVETAIAAFIGSAPAGPANQPVLVTRWPQYVETFGQIEEGEGRNPHEENAYLSHAVQGYFQNGGGRCYVIRAAPPEQEVPAEHSGILGMEIPEDVTMVCCPDLTAIRPAGGNGNGPGPDGVKAAQSAIIAHCESRGDRIAILDAPPGLSPQEVLRWRREETNYDSKYAALYYPWITIAGPDGKPMEVPPCGHIAGIYARNDTERGVHKAPANAVVRGGLEAVTPVTKAEQDLLNPNGINCIRSFPGRSPRVRGARTLSSEPKWRAVNVRRLFNFIETSIEHGIRWTVFETNDQNLRECVKHDVTSFLTGVWQDGMLAGDTPSQAFYVQCDEERNPPESRALGRFTIDVGLAAVKPEKFIVFRLSIWSGTENAS